MTQVQNAKKQSIYVFEPTCFVEEKYNKSERYKIQSSAIDALKSTKEKNIDWRNIYYMKFWHNDQSFCLATKKLKKTDQVEISYDEIGKNTTDKIILSADAAKSEKEFFKKHTTRKEKTKNGNDDEDHQNALQKIAKEKAEKFFKK